MSVDNYLKWLEDRLANLRTNDAHLEATERGIAEQRRVLADDMRKVEFAIEVYREFAKGSAATNGTETAVHPLGQGRRPTLAEELTDELRKRGGEARIRDLVAVLAHRFQGQDPRVAYNQVYNTLTRRTDLFKPNGRGVFRLTNVLLSMPSPGEESEGRQAVADGSRGTSELPLEDR